MKRSNLPTTATGVAAFFSAVVLVLSTARVSDASEKSGGPPPGHTREIAVTRIDAPPVIDGAVTEEVWGDTPVAGDFWISESRRRPTERTEVRVAADDRALYFAIRCYDSRPDKIVANQSRRDGLMGFDDHITLELDPYHNHRLISRFSVNARGTQADTMAGGRSRKIAWKGDWQAATRRLDDGWTAEIAIPFEILDFNPSTTVFGVNFLRYQSRTQESSRWADVTPQFLSEEAGHLVDLMLPRASNGTKLMAMPYASGSVNSLDRRGTARDAAANTGFDLRLDTSRNVTGVLTARPDFSQVEDVILDVGFSYNEKYRRDPRPFFQEGAAYFGSQTYFYSTRIPDFLAGGKAFGKWGASEVGVMAVGSDVDDRRDYVVAFKRDIGATVNAGATFVGSDRDEFSNRLFAVQSNGRLGRHVKFGVDVAGTSTIGRVGDGTRAVFSLGYTSSRFQLFGRADRTDTDFFPADGFLAADLSGTKAATVGASYGQSFGEGALRRADASVSFSERQTLDSRLQRQDLSMYATVETRANVQLSGGMSRGPYRPRVSTTEWLDFTYDDRFYTASVYHYTRDGRLGYGVAYSRGVFSNEPYKDVAPSAWLKPTTRTSVSYSYERADYYDVSQQHILSASWDITAEQGISGRWVQYGEPYYRLAYRRVVRRGFDLFAVYNRDPYRADQLVTKIVWTMNLLSRREAKPVAAPPPSSQP